jgi:hypothetical protein
MEDMPGRVVCMLHEIVKNWAGYPAATTRHMNPNTSNTHVLQGQCLVVQDSQERKRNMSKQYSPCVYVQSGEQEKIQNQKKRSGILDQTWSKGHTTAI